MHVPQLSTRISGLNVPAKQIYFTVVAPSPKIRLQLRAFLLMTAVHPEDSAYAIHAIIMRILEDTRIPRRIVNTLMRAICIEGANKPADIFFGIMIRRGRDVR